MTDDSDDDLLKTGGALGVFAQVAGQGDEAFISRELGDYRITGLIAEGGMSRVYRAERIDGSFEREVAIKISPVSGFSDRMRERFMLEQGVLAGLNHPNISQLYDAQVTDEGWPYIVMELVNGGPIDDFCKAQSIDDRVRLLIDVVDAVAYAHARLVVHRDIKPSNVLVNEDGRPKLLDFGIAKLIEGEERDLTKAGPMTPRYASPEQLLGQPITTASDIYQLGLLIYRVLTGDTLNENETLNEAIQRAANHRSSVIPSTHRSALPRELVLIVEQCLRTSAADRYRDTNALRDDLQAYLNGFPVSAAGQTASYRTRKFISRNRASVLTAAAAAVAIIGGGAWYTWQLAQARDLAERRAATSNRVLQTMSKLVADTFSGLVDANAERQAGDESYVERILKDTVDVIGRELAAEPDARAELLRVQGTIELVLGNVRSSAERLDEAFRLVDASTNPRAAMQIVLDRMEAANRELDIEKADEMQAVAIKLVDENQFEADVLALFRHQSGQAAQAKGNYEQSIAEFERAIELLELADSLDTRLLAQTYEEIAYTYTSWEKPAESIPAAERAIEILEETESRMTHRLIHPLRYAGYGHLMTNNLAEARRYYERALSIAEANFGEFHPDIVAVQDSMGALAYREGRVADAVRHFEEQIRIVTELEGADAANLIGPKLNVALMYADLGEMTKSGQYFGEILDATNNDKQELKRYRFTAVANEGRRLYAVGRYSEAATRYREQMSLAEELFGENSYPAISAEMHLGSALARTNELDSAAEHFLSSSERYGATREAGGEGHVLFTSNNWLLLWRRGDLTSAREKLEHLLNDKIEKGDLDVIYWAEMFADLATICMTQGDMECAREALDRGLRGAETSPNHPWAYCVKVVEAEYLQKNGQLTEAEELAGETLRLLETKYPNRRADIRRARAIVDS